MEDIKEVLKGLSERPVAYQPIYTRITGSLTAGVLLSQLIYWHYAVKEREFHKKDDELVQEIGISLWELKSARKNLRELDIIKISRRCIPAKNYYTLDMDRVISLISSWAESNQQVSRKTTNKLVGKQLTGELESNQQGGRKSTNYHTENTTETTTENTTERGTPAQIAQEFFTDYERQEGVVRGLTEKGINEQLARREIKKFVSYWTESSKNGKKLRWEGESYFDLSKRLTTWFGKIRGFERPKGKRIIGFND